MTQFNLSFENTEPLPKLSPLTLESHSESGYKPRTLRNAFLADVTVAFAVDHTSAGELLTKKAAGAKFIGFNFGRDPKEVAKELNKFFVKKNARTLNVAGNSLATMTKVGLNNGIPVTQAQCNQWVYDVLKEFKAITPSLLSIRSGGQSGIDQAGLIAALKLGVPAIGLYPAGFRQRALNGVDYTQSEEQIKETLYKEVRNLND